ncbi:hypothetical protein HOT49_gp278 [Erwinia phage vB_EamM_Alexandra]|uniref:Uncharacterized protein n=1 Tax=Erwinia phage vB_EamM_Alexandra TaxID=2201424 RepID=A0A2Z4QEJ6_9CAUD|nr:hypothetical protein HOT49_gp278 [Erwinia phage vB_EamM_Alexandra]AWY08537.1 hypothetical protein Alexandra_280 [Erwinia phage vB_EamM_Alexandra]
MLKKVKEDVSAKDLDELYSVVMEYTGSERYRLYSMLTVRKLQAIHYGHKIPKSVQSLTHGSNEYDLQEAIALLGKMK